MAIAQSLLIIASHKHYSVDVVVAWYGKKFIVLIILSGNEQLFWFVQLLTRYTVNLVGFFVDNKLPGQYVFF